MVTVSLSYYTSIDRPEKNVPATESMRLEFFLLAVPVLIKTKLSINFNLINMFAPIAFIQILKIE